MNKKKVEALIKTALNEGVLTEKEKQVLYKSVKAMGISLDEFEMVIDAWLAKFRMKEKIVKAKNGSAFVDLGLSVKWATCNVGASKPEEYGDYFAWGETEPKSTYEWKNYKHCYGVRMYKNFCYDGFKFIKYCFMTPYGHNKYCDDLDILEPCDDVVSVNYGKNFRMPTEFEMRELARGCKHEMTDLNGVNGCLITGPNGNSIFLPAAGRYDQNELKDAGSDGCYWSSSFVDPHDEPGWAYGLSFGQKSDIDTYRSLRNVGRSVRPVCDK
jgi:hypothetical protein